MTGAAEVVKQTSRTGTTMGIITIVAGLLAMMAPMLSGIATAILVAVILIGAGIAQTVFAFSAKSFGRGLLTFLFGGLAVVCGVFLLARPLVGLYSITMVLIVYFLMDGISRIVAAFRLKPMQGWGWMVFGGLSSIVLSVLIWRQWPVSGQWAVGVLVDRRPLSVQP